MDGYINNETSLRQYSYKLKTNSASGSNIFSPTSNHASIKNLTNKKDNETQPATSTWDDSEGYYCFAPGELLNSRYEVLAAHGRGVFSTVLRVLDLEQSLWTGTYAEFAIKII